MAASCFLSCSCAHEFTPKCDKCIFGNIIRNQKNIDSEYVEIVNDNFWDLIEVGRDGVKNVD